MARPTTVFFFGAHLMHLFSEELLLGVRAFSEASNVKGLLLSGLPCVLQCGIMPLPGWEGNGERLYLACCLTLAELQKSWADPSLSAPGTVQRGGGAGGRKPPGTDDSPSSRLQSRALECASCVRVHRELCASCVCRLHAHPKWFGSTALSAEHKAMKSNGDMYR